jgi:hypothetical protein
MANALTPDSPRRQHDDDHIEEPGPDADDLAPLCDEQEFTALLEAMVAEDAPRLFAVVQEYGDRADGWIAAWGMAFDGHADVVAVGRHAQMRLPAPENALRMFGLGNHIRARLMWFGREAGAPVPG